ncbi:MAG: tyrosine-protein phosphatase [Planctomycetota bacterium]|jgi:tyrosine-protein phosphatase YwqE
MLDVDLHSHLMPGVDDGSRSPVETIAMARGLAELGVEHVYLTPHQFKLDNRLSLVDVERRTDEVRGILAHAEVDLEVRRGAEYYYGEELLDALASDAEFITFAWRDEQCLLIELPMSRPAVGVRRVGDALLRRGIVPVVAHPERTFGLAREHERVQSWRDAGWRTQLNLLSLVGRHGVQAADLAHLLLEDGLYDSVGSDLHRPAELAWLRQAHEAYRSLTEGVSA